MTHKSETKWVGVHSASASTGPIVRGMVSPPIYVHLAPQSMPSFGNWVLVGMIKLSKGCAGVEWAPIQ